MYVRKVSMECVVWTQTGGGCVILFETKIEDPKLRRNAARVLGSMQGFIATAARSRVGSRVEITFE